MFLIAALLLPACHRSPSPIVGSVDHVVVVVVDGVRMEESLGDGTSTATDEPTEDYWPKVRRQLLPAGTEVRPAWNTGITITSPAHCNLFTGVRVPVGNFVATEGVGYYVPDLPTLFEAVEAGGRGRGRIVANTDLVAPAAWSMYPGLGPDHGATFELLTEPDSNGKPMVDDAPVLDQVFDELSADAPALLLTNLHSMDRAGHEGEDGEYAERVKEVDDTLATFWKRVQNDPGLKDHTVVLVLADHGRHAHKDMDEEWRQHGDACQGCRTLPMIWLGPGVPVGGVVTTPYTLEDVAATLAALLDVPLPYGQGRVMTEVFPDLAPAAPTGPIDLAAAGSSLAARTWTPDEDARSAVTIDGQTVSTPGVFAAEAPTLASGQLGEDPVTYACWRELPLDVDATEDPWVGRCARKVGDDGAWEDIGFPWAEISPVWHPALAVEGDGSLWIGASTSTNGAVNGDADTSDDLKLATWSEAGGWEVPDGGASDVSFVVHTAMVGGAAHGEPGVWHLALASSAPGVEAGRFTRHVEVREVTVDGGGTTWADDDAGDEDTDELGGVWERRESPAIGEDGETLLLAQIGYGAEGTTVLVSTSARGSHAWSPLRRVDDSGRVLAFLPPVYDGADLVWARLDDDDTVAVCRLGPTEDAPTCVSTGSPRAAGLAAADGVVTVSVDRGIGAWAAERVPW